MQPTTQLLTVLDAKSSCGGLTAGDSSSSSSRSRSELGKMVEAHGWIAVVPERASRIGCYKRPLVRLVSSSPVGRLAIVVPGR